MENDFTCGGMKQQVWQMVPEGRNTYFVELLKGDKLPKALNGKYLKKYFPTFGRGPRL
jgi:hypothetical protein